MSARFSRTLFASAARPAARAAGRNAGRRMMSSAHGAQAKSDTPWMIGSALVFGPLAIYLVTPSAKDKAHEAHEKALPKTKATPDLAEAPVPAPSDEKTMDSPASQETITDDEGNAASNAEVADSINKAVDEDSPKEAEAAEESSAKGKTQSHDAADSGEYKAKAVTSNTEPEQDKTTKEQNTDSKGLGGKDPSNVGEARVKSADGKSPKESAKEDGEKH